MSAYAGPERRADDQRWLAMEKRVTLIEQSMCEIEKKVDANTTLMQQVFDQTSEIRLAVKNGRWFGRAIAAVVRWCLSTVRMVANWAAPIVAVALAILAYLGITWKGPPPP